MSLINRFLKLTRQFFTAPWRWFWSKLDLSFRRMCVMTSLHARLMRCDDGDTDKLTRLNQKLKLIEDIDTMRFPTFVGHKLWKNVQPLDKMDSLNERYYERLFRMTPCWLLYTTKNEFIDELKTMINFCVREHNIAVKV